ncbi:hypothetical protein [Streptomyces rubradiris]|nr:hypothetical protein [Streptomyces rubradiris]
MDGGERRAGARGKSRQEARHRIAPAVERVLRAWQEKKVVAVEAVAATG